MPHKYTRRAKPSPRIGRKAPKIPGYVALALPERTRLLALLDDPVFQQAWANAQLSKPSCFSGGSNTALGTQMASDRLHQLQGWALFEAALLRQCEDPKLERKPLQETYPDAQAPKLPS